MGPWPRGAVSSQRALHSKPAAGLYPGHVPAFDFLSKVKLELNILTFHISISIFDLLHV